METRYAQQFKDTGGEGLGVERGRWERGLGKNWRSKGVERQFGGRDCGWIVRSPTVITNAPMGDTTADKTSKKYFVLPRDAKGSIV